MNKLGFVKLESVGYSSSCGMISLDSQIIVAQSEIFILTKLYWPPNLSVRCLVLSVTSLPFQIPGSFSTNSLKSLNECTYTQMQTYKHTQVLSTQVQCEHPEKKGVGGKQVSCF